MNLFYLLLLLPFAAYIRANWHTLRFEGQLRLELVIWLVFTVVGCKLGEEHPAVAMLWSLAIGSIYSTAVHRYFGAQLTQICSLTWFTVAFSMSMFIPDDHEQVVLVVGILTMFTAAILSLTFVDHLAHWFYVVALWTGAILQLAAKVSAIALDRDRGLSTAIMCAGLLLMIYATARDSRLQLARATSQANAIAMADTGDVILQLAKEKTTNKRVARFTVSEERTEFEGNRSGSDSEDDEGGGDRASSEQEERKEAVRTNGIAHSTEQIHRATDSRVHVDEPTEALVVAAKA